MEIRDRVEGEGAVAAAPINSENEEPMNPGESDVEVASPVRTNNSYHGSENGEWDHGGTDRGETDRGETDRGESESGGSGNSDLSGESSMEDEGDERGGNEELEDIMNNMPPPPPPGMNTSMGSWEYNENRLANGNNEVCRVQIGSFLSKMACSPGVSKARLQEIYEFFMKGAEDICRLKRTGNLDRRSRTMREKTYSEICPTVKTEVFGMRDGMPYLIDTVTVMSKELQTEHTAVLRSYISLKDIMGHVYRVHGIDIHNLPDDWKTIEINSDGLASAKSASSWDYHIVSLRFVKCGTPYVWSVWQYNKSRNGKIDVDSVYSPLVRELNNLGLLHVARFALDSKERKIALGMTQCNAYFSCGVCEERGRAIKRGKRNQVCYPIQWRRSTTRTIDTILECAEVYLNLRRTLKANKKNFQKAVWCAKGVMKESPLLYLRNFDMTKGTPGDFMHMIAIGIAKKIYRLLFMERHNHMEEGEESGDVKRRSENQAKEVDDFVTKVKIPTELGRRTRKVSFANIKASEWKCYCLFFFLHIALEIFNDGDGKRKKILILFTFLCRVLYQSEESYNALKRETGINLTEVMTRLSKYYQQSFGKSQVTFNEHLMFCHALDQREEHGPVTNYSCFRYEDLFGHVKNAFVKGTQNEAKQLFESLYASDYFYHHCRDKKTLEISTKPCEKRDDSLITSGGKFYRVKTKEDEILRCREVTTNVLRTAGIDVDDLPWAYVGVFFKGDEKHTEEIVHKRDIDGKGIIVGNMIMRVEDFWLRE